LKYAIGHNWVVAVARLLLIIFVTCFLCSGANAGLRICNKTAKTAYVALGTEEHSEGWFRTEPGECSQLIAGPLRYRYYYYYAEREDAKWMGSNDQRHGWYCVHPNSKFYYEGPIAIDAYFVSHCAQPPGLKQVPFRRIDTGESGSDFEFDLNHPEEKIPSITTGTVHKQCLISWDDSHQIHSVRPVIKWNYQAVKTRMKKLRHCIELTVTGPTDISGVAQSYVKSCVDHALNDSRTIYILQGIIALGADVLGSTGGAASTANIIAYIDHVKTTALSCLTDSARIESHLQGVLRNKFNASIRKESHWEYWDL
jgi:hypothetical protein